MAKDNLPRIESAAQRGREGAGSTTDDAGAADDAAVAWFVRLRDEEATDADRSAFAAWLASDNAHREAWNEIERVWGGLGRIGDVKPAVVALRSPNPSLPRRSATGWRRLATAAVVLLAVLAGWRLAPVGLLADHRTGIAERRLVVLGDGSQVELGPESVLDVAYDGARRRVRLMAGRAFFSIVRETGRPFMVEAGQGRVEVLGTAFDVGIGDGDSVSVAVTQHAVSVSAADSRAVRLGEGQAVSYDRNGLSAVRDADLDAVQAWRRDQLVFHDAPLAAVLAELGRYRRGHVQLIGGDLGSRRVTAVFDARSPDAAIETIARSLDLRLLRATSLFIALSAW